jgi:hypothetical protein
MTATAASRLVLVAAERPRERPPSDRVRHYRLARAKIAALRVPKHPQLARMHD